MSYGGVMASIKRYNWKNRETKMISNYISEQQISTVSGQGVYIIPFPAPAIGTGANQRVGNKIDMVGIKVNILFNSNASLPLVCRMLILGVPQGSNFFDSDVAANIFDVSIPATSAEVSGGCTGFLSDINRQINRNELKTIRDQVIPLNSNTVDFSFAQRIIYVRTPGRATFHDSDLSQPQTMRYVMALMPRQANADESTGSTIECSYSLTTYFKDV